MESYLISIKDIRKRALISMMRISAHTVEIEVIYIYGFTRPIIGLYLLARLDKCRAWFRWTEGNNKITRFNCEDAHPSNFLGTRYSDIFTYYILCWQSVTQRRERGVSGLRRFQRENAFHPDLLASHSGFPLYMQSY